MAAGELSTQVRRNLPIRVEDGPDNPLGGTRRGTDPQEPGIGRWQRLLGTQVDETVRV